MADVHNKEVRSKKIYGFKEKILEWYKENERNFYWCTPNLSAFKYIIAEVLLKRIKAETIARFFPLFLEEFPCWKSLANAQADKVEHFLFPEGLYR